MLSSPAIRALLGNTEGLAPALTGHSKLQMILTINLEKLDSYFTLISA